MNTQTIQATVNPRLLQKASRLFTGTVEGRIIEVLQNARRAEATEVQITNADGFVTVRDNGRGIEEFQNLLDLGSSGWDDAIELSEDPAGVGLFCLAPRVLTIRSHGKIVTIKEDGWTGTPVEIHDDSEPEGGTLLRFPDSQWEHGLVDVSAVFCGLKVTVDGHDCPSLPFVSDAAIAPPGLGCRIEVRRSEELNSWHRSCRRGRSYCDNVLVNFHGQVVAFDYHPVSERNLHFLVDLTDQPTGIRLMLPARTCLVENEAFGALKAVLELEAYRYIERCGKHALPYKEYLRAKALGIALPEATPTYAIGLLATGNPPDPIEIEAPKDFPLKKCYRFGVDSKPGEETDEANVHLLAALGTFETPFVPVNISGTYDGYSWAKLATIGSVKVRMGKKIHEDWLWGGTMVCVESIFITARMSDGRTFSSPVCMAVLAPKKNKQWSDASAYVTKEARQRLSSSEIWYHLGGYNDEGDTFETQDYQFGEELERFWADVIGPDEHLRQQIVEAVGHIRDEWKQVAVASDGTVTIHLQNGKKKTLKPLAADSPTAAA